MHGELCVTHILGAYLEVTVLDDTASCQLHSSFQQAVGDRRAILQETGLLPRAQRHVGPGSGHTAQSNPPKTCMSKAGNGGTYIHVGMGCLAEVEVAGRARQESQAADVVARRGCHVVVGCIGNAGWGTQESFQYIDKIKMGVSDTHEPS